MIAAAVIIMTAVSSAVSYTHLDVYKRQAADRNNIRVVYRQCEHRSKQYQVGES